MSGFSSELIDYLEGRISFEEFEIRREERKAKLKVSNEGRSEEDEEIGPDDTLPSTSHGRSPRKCSKKRPAADPEEGVSPSVQKAFASMMGEGTETEQTEEEDDDDDYEEEEEEEEDSEEERKVEAKGDEEGPSAGDVFALEMELNRENKKMMKERRNRSKLPRALRGLMGEANIRYARGDKEDAVLMCMEIIRQAPLAYEPFSTLAMIYEDQGDMEKSLQFGLIAAHLNPSDCEEWVKLADMSLEQDNIRQAIICYTKAIKYDPSNVRYLWERCSLYEQVGEHKQSMDGYRRILNLLPPTDGEHFMQLSRDMAKSYYESSDLPSAMGVMEEALRRHPELVTDESINMAAELYIANHQHGKALQVLVQFCGIVLDRGEPKTDLAEEENPEGQEKMEAEENPEEQEKMEAEENPEGQEKMEAEENPEGQEKMEAEENPDKEKEMETTTTEETGGEVRKVVVPDHVPVDIRVKLMVCLIHQHVYRPLDSMLTSLMEQSPEELGDLYLDVAEAFLDEGEYNSALPLLSALVCSERYNLAVVWLRHAECLKALGHMEVAVKSYSKVVQMAPLHLEARLCLSTLQQQLGRPLCALKALEPMYDPDTLAQDASAAQQELKLLLHRSTLLRSQGRLDDYLDSMLTMLAMLLKVAMTRAQVCVRASMWSGVRHLRLVKVSKDLVSDIDDQEAAYQDISGKTSVLSREDWWLLLVRCVCTLCEMKRFKEAELLVDSSLEFYSFYDVKVKRKELEFFGLSAAFLDHNYRKAYDYIRLTLMEKQEWPMLWNVFNQVTLHSQDVRHHRFCLRLMMKNPDNHALCVLSGHNALVSGSFKHALGQYVQAFRSKPDEPLYSLCVGLTFFHMASQKFVVKHHPLILQGFSFLWRYVELRGHCQESMYNLGRALQQMGLAHLAIHYYHKALSFPPLTLEGIEADQVDLRREIAFNLSIIYQASGNTEMVRHLINTYCMV
ncbi:general transcription factor 3C polypeptide 3 [Salmo salar]|uniref:General transcription factor 3C polypeptide 3 n=1 Tax=Salmo salar TaxID=8030 RepID=A0ABM3D9E5_SALSA|nr:general transcription factor 3C polypeptide 3 [Salmo salar]XP_045555431.1 general transcription factor 3C polypeptide 3 [Salmo salar]XP_045555433.1 general transcription factor 3C polypeptide 3 [Salmo salar]XP_045555434.1 general transcription factor 3C polypeptide 3 [Salmo salar]XP_045555435.1 general transcription factor 3C polypeptide 3 [Salmo salar]XP_045555436.1 general transcription factor 3C polypeptide 3 [Salmo salar]XP_045555437.1 general transcription factor 3C polypeptide 3 [Sal